MPVWNTILSDRHWILSVYPICGQCDCLRSESQSPPTPTPTPTPTPKPVAKPTPVVAQKPVVKPTNKWIAESGTFVPNFAINVRSGASTASAVVATYNKGESVRYDSYYNDGRYVWIHYKSYGGYDRYMVCRENGIAWGSFSWQSKDPTLLVEGRVIFVYIGAILTCFETISDSIVHGYSLTRNKSLVYHTSIQGVHASVYHCTLSCSTNQS